MLDPWRASVTYIKINIPDKPGESKLTMVTNWQNYDDTAIKTLKSAQQKVHKSKASSYEKHIMTKFITKKYKNNRQMEIIKRSNSEHKKQEIINACTMCGEQNGDEWSHVMFRCPITIWLSEVITQMAKVMSNTKKEKGIKHINSKDGIPADLKLLHYIDITNEYVNKDKITITKIAWLCTIAHSFLHECFRTMKARPSRNELSSMLIQQIRNSQRVYKETWGTKMNLGIEGSIVSNILNTADLTYLPRHNDYESIGLENINFKNREIISLQKLAAFAVARNQHMKDINMIFENNKITRYERLSDKDRATVNNKIKDILTDEESEDINNPELDEITENPINEALLEFLRNKKQAELISKEYYNEDTLMEKLQHKVQLAYESLNQAWREQTSLTDTLTTVRGAVKWILG